MNFKEVQNMKETKKYAPAPIDTSSVSIPANISVLAELLAENTHNVWAKDRIKQGWVYGPVRNDEKKETPCLVPYEALTEDEKKHDRSTSLETLRLVLKLGYTLRKDGEQKMKGIIPAVVERNAYVPAPIDTSEGIFSQEVLKLADLLSKNTHEVWAQNRMEQGWTYGETRNDEKKHNPCLVPYEELTEEEKSYDFNTSMETLKLIVKLGYKLIAPAC
jgi:hypothetical protein